MKKNSKRTLAMLSIILAASLTSSMFTVTPSRAADYTNVGVSLLSWAHYSMVSNSTQLGPTNMNLTVLEIDRSNVTMKIIQYNETHTYTTTIEGNITIGASNTSVPYFIYLIAGGLVKDDPVYLGAPFAINDTAKEIAGGQARVCNRLRMTMYGSPIELHWDQTTGIVVYFNMTGGGVTGALTLISTSLWSSFDYNEVGVQVGDWARYSMDVNLPGGADVATAKFTITDIDRLNVTMSISYWFSNNTLAGTFAIWGNLSSGEWGPIAGTTMPMFFLLLAANLGEDAPVYMNAEAWINETTTMNTYFVQRAVNHLRAVGPMGADLMAFDFYWDQATGMTVKGNMTGLTGSISGLHQIWTLTSTSLWSPPAPTIDQPTAVTYTYGETGNSITWHPTSQIPCNYTIARNGSMLHCTRWTGAAITFDVDGLEAGTYLYTCVVNDTLSRQSTSNVVVTVEASAPLGEGLPVTTLLIIGGGIAAVAIVAGIIVLRRRGM